MKAAFARFAPPLVTLVLIARLPAVERAIGQDRLVKLHRRLGPAIIGLVSVHVVAVVLGYAAQVIHVGVREENLRNALGPCRTTTYIKSQIPTRDADAGFYACNGDSPNLVNQHFLLPLLSVALRTSPPH